MFKWVALTAAAAIALWVIWTQRAQAGGPIAAAAGGASFAAPPPGGYVTPEPQPEPPQYAVSIVQPVRTPGIVTPEKVVLPPIYIPPPTKTALSITQYTNGGSGRVSAAVAVDGAANSSPSPIVSPPVVSTKPVALDPTALPKAGAPIPFSPVAIKQSLPVFPAVSPITVIPTTASAVSAISKAVTSPTFTNTRLSSGLVRF